MVSQVETRTKATLQNASLTSSRNAVRAPKGNKQRRPFLAGLLKALSAFAV